MNKVEPVYLHKLKSNLRDRIPEYQNMAEVVADVLSLSKEAAYRRLRGESTFSLAEAILLKKHLGISLDALLDECSSIAFNYEPMFNTEKSIFNYLNGMRRKLEKCTEQHNQCIHLVSGDLPFFYQLGFDHLLRFKLYFWQNQTNPIDQDSNVFQPDQIDGELVQQCKTIYKHYQDINTSEVWSTNMLSSTLSQVEYMSQCQLFMNTQDVEYMFEDLSNLVLEAFMNAKRTTKNGMGTFELFTSETDLTSNSALLKRDKRSILAIGFNGFNSIQTTDQKAIDEFESWREAVISKSIKISGSGEKQRFHFKERCLKGIQESKNKCLDILSQRRMG